MSREASSPLWSEATRERCEAQLCFERLIPELLPSVFRLFVCRVGRFAADDLTAETFATAYRNRANYDSARASAKAWIWGIATNVALRHERDRRRGARALASYAASAGVARQDPADEIDGQVDAEREIANLNLVLESLDEYQRQAIYLVAAGLTNKEVAEALGVPIGTVKSRISRARSAISAAIANTDNLPGSTSSSRGRRSKGNGI